MELVSFGKEVLQNIAEHAASYRFGQLVLRQLDRSLWVVEKCARWAVPPPLDQDERPQPVLVRPLPWVFFLMMLFALRVTRECISLLNLVMGKPPLRSADVVMFIQGKRRYLRTLKYQGNRMMRARTSTQTTQQPWYSSLHSLFELTMCFRRQPLNYGNNNTTRVTNNDEVMVVKPTKRGQKEETPSTPANETTMERLIEKIMLELDVESDEDSSYTLTNATSPKSERSELTESDQDTICNETSSPKQPHDTEISQTNGDDIHFSPNKNENSSSTPEKTENKDIKENENNNVNQTFQISDPGDDHDTTVTESSLSKKADEKRKLEENITESAYTGNSVSDNADSVEDSKTCEEAALPPPQESNIASPKQDTENFIQNESSAVPKRTPKKEHKIANGRSVKSVPSKKKGTNRERRDSNEVPQQRARPSNSSY